MPSEAPESAVRPGNTRKHAQHTPTTGFCWLLQTRGSNSGSYACIQTQQRESNHMINANTLDKNSRQTLQHKSNQTRSSRMIKERKTTYQSSICENSATISSLLSWSKQTETERLQVYGDAELTQDGSYSQSDEETESREMKTPI